MNGPRLGCLKEKRQPCSRQHFWSRIAGLSGKSSGYIENLSDGAKENIEAIEGVQVTQNEDKRVWSPNKRKVIRLRPCTPVRPSPCSSCHPPIANTSGARISLHSRCEFLGRFLLDSLVSLIRPNVRNMRTDLLLFMPLMGPPVVGENKASAAQSVAVR